MTESNLGALLNVEILKLEEFPKRGVTKQWVKSVPIKEFVEIFFVLNPQFGKISLYIGRSPKPVCETGGRLFWP